MIHYVSEHAHAPMIFHVIILGICFFIPVVSSYGTHCDFILFPSVLPEVSVTSNQTRISARNTATLECNATEGVPMVYTYSWVHNGNLLPSEISPILTNVDEDGTYTCVVTNEAGDAMDSIFIQVGCEKPHYNYCFLV